MSKGENDPFKSLKTLALDLSTKYKNDGSRIAWVSIRLPPMLSDTPPAGDIMLNTLYGRNEILSVAVADLALPKIGLDSLVLMASTDINMKGDFLNRVRMNTIQGFQIYSPIGFRMYPCRFAYFCRECETCDVSQGTGYFDKWNYDVISFYSRDYVQARQRLESTLPITRSDNDIEQLLSHPNQKINTVLDMFVASQLPLHILRGTEPNLRYGNAIRHYINNGGKILKCPALEKDDVTSNAEQPHISNEIPQRYDAQRADTGDNTQAPTGLDSHKCIHLASRKQIGDAIIRYEDRSILHK
uniref:Hexosyltransferase n=2 Tax=Ceratitis capitata TaxID=7213 RepID=W8B6G0_CERCA